MLTGSLLCESSLLKYQLVKQQRVVQLLIDILLLYATYYCTAPLYLRTLWRYTNAVIIIIIIIIIVLCTVCKRL